MNYAHEQGAPAMDVLYMFCVYVLFEAYVGLHSNAESILILPDVNNPWQAGHG